MNPLIEFDIVVITVCVIYITLSLRHIEKGMDIMFKELIEKAEFAIKKSQQEEQK